MSGFQERLKSARQRLGLTQEALAEELNVTKASVSAWETGREKPGFRLLPRLRIVLGTSLDDLICGGDTDGEPPEVTCEAVAGCLWGRTTSPRPRAETRERPRATRGGGADRDTATGP